MQITWDSAPVKTQFGDMRIVCDGVAEVSGKRYRINASATRGARKPELMLRYLTKARSGVAVPEAALPEVRAAALASFAELLKPIRAAIIAEREAADIAEFGAVQLDNDLLALRVETVTEAPVTLSTDHRTDATVFVRGYMRTSADGMSECLLAELPDGRFASTGWIDRTDEFNEPGRRWHEVSGLDAKAEFIGTYPAPHLTASPLLAEPDESSFAEPIVLPHVAGFCPTGNIAPIGRAYRAGELDSFQVAAILDWMAPARLAQFFSRWA